MLSHKKLLIGSLSFAFLASLIFQYGLGEILGGIAHAQENPSNVNMYHNAASVMSLVITGMEFLTYLFINLLSALMDPRFILGIVQGGGGQEILRSIWELSRDVMNVIFAFILIVSALYMVVVPEKGDSVVKPKMVKFVIGVLLVNFSWFFPRVILDIANVATATVYQIPSLMAEPECSVRDDSSSGDTNTITTTFQPCEYIVDVKVFTGAERALRGTGYEPKVGGLVAVKTDTMTDDQMRTSTGILYGLVYNHGRLGKLTHILAPTSSPTAPNDLSDSIRDLIFFIVHTFFVLAVESMLFFPLAAMVAAFILRIIVIWLTVAFMPFMFISFVLDSVAGFDTMDIFKKYVKAAFLPAVVGVPIAAGFIFINAAVRIAPPGGLEILDENTGPLLMGVNSFWHLLFLITCYMIIWKGFFFAMSNYDNMYANIANSVQGVGSRIGGGILKSPLSLPVPVPKSLDFGKSPTDSRAPLGQAVGGLFGGKRVNQGGGALNEPGVSDKSKAQRIDQDKEVVRKLEGILEELRKDKNTTRALSEANKVVGSGDKFSDIDELFRVVKSSGQANFSKKGRDVEQSVRP